ncbi:hypothetical protein [Streptomyces spiramyceticus]|uniref:hypothetical protein n=1 Tax=Streptomyces spiramyceticus TaxID=299717 RepID=UPI00237B4419|nr:hypothetical protein [Streptomyces spiramyceticus]
MPDDETRTLSPAHKAPTIPAQAQASADRRTVWITRLLIVGLVLARTLNKIN